MQCDAAALEWRTILELSKDSIGINEVLQGEDTHSKNQEAFKLPSRLIAKIFLFRTIYRGSGWSFSNDPDFMHVSTSAKFWDEMNAKFYTKYHGIDTQHQRWKDIVVSGKPIIGPFGRQWTLPMSRDYKGELRVPMTTLTNYPVQGTGADIMMLVRLMAYKRIRKANILCDFVSTVHDSIVVDTKKKHLEEIKNIFDSCFADIPKQMKQLFNYDWVVPMTCECKYGENLKEMHKF